MCRDGGGRLSRLGSDPEYVSWSPRWTARKGCVRGPLIVECPRSKSWVSGGVRWKVRLREFGSVISCRNGRVDDCGTGTFAEIGNCVDESCEEVVTVGSEKAGVVLVVDQVLVKVEANDTYGPDPA